MKEINRRSFLASSALTAAGFMLPIGRSMAQGNMRTRAIPGTNEQVPIIGFGASRTFYELPEEGKELPLSLINTMMEHGGRFIDSPPYREPGVPVMGQLMSEQNLQKDLFLCAKIFADGKEAGRLEAERSIANLGKDPLDLMLVHSMRDMHFHWPTLKDMKEEGKVRYIGTSFSRPGEQDFNNYANFGSLESFMRKESPDFIMVPYSIHNPEISERILPLAMDMGTAVITIEVFKAFDDGGFFSLVAGKDLPDWAAEFDCNSWAQFALKFNVSHPAVTFAITETRNVSHVIDNMGAGYGRLPDQAMRKRMSDYLLSI